MLAIVQQCLGSKRQCQGLGEIGRINVSLLSLLELRLGCTMGAEAYCPVVCGIGSESPRLTVPSMEMVLVDDFMPVDGDELRVVRITSSRPREGLILFRLRFETRQPWVSVVDAPTGARKRPMQVTTLRAALQHRSFHSLCIEWSCAMTPTHSSRPSPEVPVPDFCSAAFRDPAAAAEWAVKATELSAIYSRRAKSSALCAQRVSELMTEISYSSVVQRVLRYPLVSESLDKSGYFVYCLLSPYLTKVYVGATGFLGPRAPYEQLRPTCAGSALRAFGGPCG